MVIKLHKSLYFIPYLFKCFAEVAFILIIPLCIFKISFLFNLSVAFACGHHPCERQCRRGQTPRTCIYNFSIEWYLTLSKVLFHTFLHETLDFVKNICGTYHVLLLAIIAKYGFQISERALLYQPKQNNIVNSVRTDDWTAK